MNCSVAVGDGGVGVGREPEAARRGVALDQRLEPGLVDRDAARVQRRDLRRVDVEAQHVVADLREAGAGDEPDVAGADDGDLHAAARSEALIAASAPSGSGACVIGRPTTR